MNKREYFDFFKKHLPKDKHRDRFLEDLEEHFEDALYTETLKKQTPEARVLERMGDPNQTLLYYKHFMSKKSSLYPFFESFFWGLFSVPLYLTTFIANGVTEQTEVLLYKAIWWFITAACLAGISYLFYRFAFSNLRPSNDLLSPKEKIFSFIVNIIPAWIFTATMISGFYDQNFGTQDHFFPLVIGAYAAVISFFAWKAFAKSLKKALIVRSSLNHLLTLALLSSFLLPDFLEVVSYALTSSWWLLCAGNLKWAIWTSGLFMVGLGIFCLYSLFNWFKNRDKAFPLLKMSLFLAILHALFFPSSKITLSTQEFIWNKPSVDLTEYLEKKEMGSFRLWAEKFIYNYNQSGINYETAYMGNGFVIHMHDFANLAFSPESLEELNWQELGGDPREFLNMSDPVLHEDLSCELSARAAMDYEGLEPPVLGGETECLKFYFKDELIFSQRGENPLMLRNAIFSPDQKWLLLEFENLIYLVQL